MHVLTLEKLAKDGLLAGKRVLIRSDLNAPHDENGRITNETRLVASVPAGIIGILFNDVIDSVLSTPYVIAATLILYGVLFLILESRNKQPKVKKFSELTYQMALLIGVCQMLALIPGTSRSGATILGAVFLGCSRFVAAEFSFFLAIPAMLGASGVKILIFLVEGRLLGA